MTKRFSPWDMFFGKRGFTWLDRLSFPHVLFIWIGIILIFGIVYFLLSTPHSLLLSNPTNLPVRGVMDSIYFSFITATFTGFGDIVPVGSYKIIAIFEVTLGVLLLAFVTSKLVSLKQDIILNEIYEISFNERINRLRSSLLLFRQNINRTINRIEEHSIRKREIDEIYIYFSSLANVLKEVSTLLDKRQRSHFTKGIDPVDTELIFNSVVSSFKRTNELINVLGESGLEWKREVTLNFIRKCLSLNREIFEKLKLRRILSEQVIEEVGIRNEEIIKLIRSTVLFS
ncbi:two pore domain potassium channel family protein [Candidatus Woesearchaeota archaeon]|nr:two pore domain potassium channel family protein [Candidatus Woesearchaeota archaeon]